MTPNRSAAMEEARDAKRRSARDAAAALTSAGISFTTLRCGVQFVIRHKGSCYDLWPGTGRWRQRDNQLREGSLCLHGVSLIDGNDFESLLVELQK